jgi:oligopeptide/dipeptide ABC transporter ATP-binding protein
VSAVRYRATFVRLLGFLRPYRVGLVVSIVLAVGSQAAQIALVWVTGRDVIDKALIHRDTHRLWISVIAIVGLGIVRAVLMGGRRLISGRQALDVEMDMRSGLYAHLVRLSFGFYDRHQTGQLMSRATVDLQGVRFFLGYGLIFFFQNALTVVSVTVVLFFFEWKLALIVLAVTPFLILLAYRYSHVAHPTLRDVQQRLADVATVAEENIVGVHVVKAFAQEPAEQAKFVYRSERVFEQTVRANRQRATYVPLISFVPMLATAAVLLIGARMVAHHTLSVGSFVAFNLYLGMLVLPLRALGMWVGQAQRATAAGERIFEVIDEPEEIADAPDAMPLPPGGGAVRFEHVTFEYLDDRPVLHDVDLEIAPGRTVALIGHTGSGKTTLTSLVPRFYDATAGRVLVDGADVRHVQLASLRREIGVIAQDPFLFSATVRENIAFGRGDLSDEDVARAAHAAQAHEFIEKLPKGYDTVIGERGITLSGGQRQRIAIARSLAANPSVIVLDEPLASLDASAQAQLANLLVDLSRELELGLLLISHDLAIVRHIADAVSVMYLGLMVETGPTLPLWQLPLHPYSEALIAAVPHPDGTGFLPEALPGEVPDPANPPRGCRFHPRCPYVFDRCRTDEPPLVPLQDGRTAACWLQPEGAPAASPGDRVKAQLSPAE